jgi:hypothetical protein
MQPADMEYTSIIVLALEGRSSGNIGCASSLLSLTLTGLPIIRYHHTKLVSQHKDARRGRAPNEDSEWWGKAT